MSKFILGGRMGDLVHALYVIKNWSGGGKHDLYITDRRDLHSDGFVFELSKTIDELTPVLMMQDYVNSVQAYSHDDPVTELTHGEWINLNMWRRYVYSASWTNLLSKVFNVPVTSGSWINFNIPTSIPFKIVHCSIHEARRGNWENIDLTGFIFMGSHDEYKNFHRPDLKFVTPLNLFQMFMMINSCEMFIGNQSLPLAIAHSLDVKRIGVLNTVDYIAYRGEEKIYSNFKYTV